MPEKKGLWHAIMRMPTRVVCLLLLLVVALLLVHTIQFTPKNAMTAPEDFYITEGGVSGWNSSAYESDFYSYDALGQSILDVTKAAVVGGVIVGAIVLAWLIAFLPKKTPLLLFPIVGAVLAFVFIGGLQLKPAGESAPPLLC